MAWFIFTNAYNGSVDINYLRKFVTNYIANIHLYSDDK